MPASDVEYVVEYRTVGGSRHKWEGAAMDADCAVQAALDDSYQSMKNDDHWHSLISVDRK